MLDAVASLVTLRQLNVAARNLDEIAVQKHPRFIAIPHHTKTTVVRAASFPFSLQLEDSVPVPSLEVFVRLRIGDDAGDESGPDGLQ
ncbi:hypothetical protein GEV33_005443 [Tenebrio molitor]|uniref:Uncharacterized protein n=1 Tax=Tenebrio molitor TaxID=7067 RepID=A0A8J6HNA0_TENMO|nr:hypothetical protein GEV33_005443 [Tenebrio molitor]